MLLGGTIVIQDMAVGCLVLMLAHKWLTSNTKSPLLPLW